eukprot:TRINITY_DN5852_c0_g1_i1.p1 TRINITY_DN5852_c0_g1~~TRINITY_DN5852_c0_g1_i1.p1  ORF type:complete len:609 (-),score=36.61 TRINITY_DN5852_c0_g1_i1:18-1844(-)
MDAPKQDNSWWPKIINNRKIRWLSLARFVLIGGLDELVSWDSFARRLCHAGVHHFPGGGATIFHLVQIPELNPAQNFSINQQRQLDLWEAGRKTAGIYSNEVWVMDEPRLTTEEYQVLCNLRRQGETIYCQPSKKQSNSPEQYVLCKLTDEDGIQQKQYEKPTLNEIPQAMRTETELLAYVRVTRGTFVAPLLPLNGVTLVQAATRQTCSANGLIALHVPTMFQQPDGRIDLDPLNFAVHNVTNRTIVEAVRLPFTAAISVGATTTLAANCQWPIGSPVLMFAVYYNVATSTLIVAPLCLFAAVTPVNQAIPHRAYPAEVTRVNTLTGTKRSAEEVVSEPHARPLKKMKLANYTREADSPSPISTGESPSPAAYRWNNNSLSQCTGDTTSSDLDSEDSEQSLGEKSSLNNSATHTVSSKQPCPQLPLHSHVVNNTNVRPIVYTENALQQDDQHLGDSFYQLYSQHKSVESTDNSPPAIGLAAYNAFNHPPTSQVTKQSDLNSEDFSCFDRPTKHYAADHCGQSFLLEDYEDPFEEQNHDSTLSAQIMQCAKEERDGRVKAKEAGTTLADQQTKEFPHLLDTTTPSHEGYVTRLRVLIYSLLIPSLLLL